MNFFVGLAAIADLILLLVLGRRVRRARADGGSLRLRIFFALAFSTLTGAFVTGAYVSAEEAMAGNLASLLARIAPKAFVVGSVLIVGAAVGASVVGRRLARPVEELTEVARRIAEGERSVHLPRGDGREARHLSKALASMRRELEGRPYAAAFLRDAWHDLKTPAAAMKATVEVLEDGAQEDADARARFLGNLRRSSEQLERTLEDLITLARFETSALGSEEMVNLQKLSREVIEANRPLAEARDVSLSVKCELSAGQCSLRGSPSALSRALGNLVENAIGATEAGGEVIIEFSPTDKPMVSMAVRNHPACVPQDIRRILFERGASSRKTRKSSGLGLPIARAAVEAHGGKIGFALFGPPEVKIALILPRK